jgi:hypothetical protein
VGAVKRLAFALLLVAAAACAVPYEPAAATVPALPADAFARALDVVRVQYPRLAVADAGAFKIQSQWLPFDRAQATGERRATVYLDGGDRLCVVVETRYLGVGLLGEPSWSSVRGDPQLERELLEALVQALGS